MALAWMLSDWTKTRRREKDEEKSVLLSCSGAVVWSGVCACGMCVVSVVCCVCVFVVVGRVWQTPVVRPLVARGSKCVSLFRTK